MERCKYIEVKRAIRQEIETGKYVSEPLMGRREMAAQFHTTTATCNKAVKELIREGVLHTIPGKGTFQHPNYGSAIRSLHIWIPSLEVFFYSRLAQRISRLAGEYNYTRVTINMNRLFPKNEPEILAGQLEDPNADVFLYSIHDPRSISVLLRHPEQVVLMGRGDAALDGKIDRARIPRSQGEKMSVDHLIRNGHRRIAYICTNPIDSPENDGYTLSLQENGIPVNRKLKFVLPKWDISEYAERQQMIEECIRRYLRFSDRPSAVFCYTNEVAAMFLTACLKVGLRVPEDLSIASYEGTTMPETGVYQIESAGPQMEKTLRILLQRLSSRGEKIYRDFTFDMEMLEGNTVRNINPNEQSL